jgi:hypothetical protein
MWAINLDHETFWSPIDHIQVTMEQRCTTHWIYIEIFTPIRASLTHVGINSQIIDVAICIVINGSCP